MKKSIGLITMFSAAVCIVYPLFAEEPQSPDKKLNGSSPAAAGQAPAVVPQPTAAQPAAEEAAVPQSGEAKQQDVKAQKKPAKEIIVTETGSDETDGKKMYYIILNDQLKVAEIEASKIAGKTIIKYPVYLSKRSGRAYPQVKIVSKQANDAITKAIETGKAVKPAGAAQDLEPRISVFNPSRSASRKVNVEVTFSEAISVSCGIMETGAEPWIAWPSRKDDQTGQYLQQIFFKGTLKKKTEDLILKKYQVYKTEGDTGEWK